MPIKKMLATYLSPPVGPNLTLPPSKRKSGDFPKLIQRSDWRLGKRMIVRNDAVLQIIVGFEDGIV